jgi:tetratricopeptide (TPR) repeat protein
VTAARSRRAVSRRGAVHFFALLSGMLCLCLPLRLPADALAQLPSVWSGTLTPVPEVDISGAERVGQAAITETRERLAGLLAAADSDAANLAVGYGKLAALYQLVNIKGAAALCWENARSLQPDEFRWSYYAGYLALKEGQTETALSRLQQATALKPDYAPLNLRMGQLWLDTDQLDKAQAALQAAAAEPGLRAAALYYLGQLDLLKRDYQAAVNHLTEALKLDPQASGVHYPLAQAYRHLGEEQLAREHMARFKLKRPDADDPLVAELENVLQTSRKDFSSGLKAIGERDYKTAIEQFEKGLEVDPDNLAARVSYARALYLGGQSGAAEKQLTSVLAHDPQQELANFLLAVLYEGQGKSGQAAEGYRRILALDPKHQGACFFLGNLLFQAGDYQHAAQQYQAVLAANPDIPPARLLELVARQHAGQADREIAAELEERIKSWPEQSELKYALARMRALSKDPAVRDAVAALTLANALAASQPSPSSIAVLALAAAADGQFDEAARVQQQLIDMFGWMATPQQAESLQKTLATYKQGAMPQQPVWPVDDPMLAPMPLDPAGPFRDYPAPVPF